MPPGTRDRSRAAAKSPRPVGAGHEALLQLDTNGDRVPTPFAARRAGALGADMAEGAVLIPNIRAITVVATLFNHGYGLNCLSEISSRVKPEAVTRALSGRHAVKRQASAASSASCGGVRDKTGAGRPGESGR